jgi:hypothetical protein
MQSPEIIEKSGHRQGAYLTVLRLGRIDQRPPRESPPHGRRQQASHQARAQAADAAGDHRPNRMANGARPVAGRGRRELRPGFKNLQRVGDWLRSDPARRSSDHQARAFVELNELHGNFRPWFDDRT